MDRTCDGVIECTALVLAEGCAELDGRLTLFGVLDEILPAASGETSFVVYAKFEGCEHVAERERGASILITDEHEEVLADSGEYEVWLGGDGEPATIVATFELPEDFGDVERLLWVEAVLEEETIAQTAVRVRDRYSV